MGQYYLSVSGIAFLFCMIALSLQHKHLLGALLSLEGGFMCLFFLLFILSSTFFSGYSALVLITLGVCEASLGLTMLVRLIRAHGNDYVQVVSLQKC